MKKLLILLLFVSSTTMAQKIYNPSANAEKDIEAAIKKAKKEGKHVLIQAGGNWCKWCLEFARLGRAEPAIDSVMKASYVWYHLNWSKENENKAIFKKYGFPQRFGFPVFIILDAKGKRLNTQNSEYLEDGQKSYSIKKVVEFLVNWSPAALDGKQYQ